MNRVVAFGLIGPVIVGLLGAFVYVPAVAYLSGQLPVSMDIYEVAFVIFLVMGLVPGWMNLMLLACGIVQFRWSITVGLIGGAIMAFIPMLAGVSHENPIVCAALAMAASAMCWMLSVRTSVKRAAAPIE